MPFDASAARAAGYSEDEILRHLTSSRKFDIAGAMESGYSKADIINHLANTDSAGKLGPAAIATRDKVTAMYPQYLGPQSTTPDRSVWDIVKGGAQGLIGDTVEGITSAVGRVAKGPQNLRDIAWMAAGPLGPLVGDIVQSHVDTAGKAVDAARRGDYIPAGGYALASLLPMIGPATAQSAEMIGDRDPAVRARGFGQVAANLAGDVAPRIAGRIRQATVVPKFGGNVNPTEAAAVRFARENNIPVSAAAATGNTFIKGVQKVADASPLGSIVTAKAERATSDALRRVGGELTARADTAPTTPELAGAATRGAVQGTIEDLSTIANRSYSELRKLEQDPSNIHKVYVRDDPESGKPIYQDMALPVDMRPVKRAMLPIYQDLVRRMPIAQQRASAGMLAITNILNEGDYKPASIAEADLGAIKEAARGADLPQLRSISQGLAAQAVKEFDTAIRRAVGEAKRSATVVDARNPMGGGGAERVPAQLGPGTETPVSATVGGISSRADITIPGARPLPARYEVRELSELQPSHQGATFQANPNYGIVNDRDYTRLENQTTVVEGSTPEKFDPRQLITDNPDATTGPMVIDSQGNVLGGNGRTMIMQRVYGSQDPGMSAAYRGYLEQRAPMYGVDPAQLQGMKQPVLVRVVDDAAFPDAAAKQAAITDLNKSGTAPLRPAERAIADSRRVSQSTLDDVAGRLEQLGDDATLGDALSGPAGVDIIQRLTDDGVITTQEHRQLVEGKQLTPDGKRRVTSLLLGRFFADPGQLDNVPIRVQKSLERIAAPLAKIEGTPFALTDTIKGALSLIDEAKSAGAKTLDEYLSQGGLFGDSKYSPDQVRMAKHLRNTKQAELAQAVKHYAEDAEYAQGGSGLFGDVPTPEQSFAASFGRDVADAADETAAAATAAAAPVTELQLTEPKAPARIGPRVEGVPAGGDAIAALTGGRKATAKKWEAAQVLKQMREEPVQVFQQATYRNDSGVNQLREWSRMAPDQMRQLGRAYLEDLFRRATEEGGFKRAGSLYESWAQLGPETKRIIFQTPGLIRDLDHFFLVAKRIGENPNPSGTAIVNFAGGQAALLIHNPVAGVVNALAWGKVAKLLRNPKGVKLLTEGLTVPIGNRGRGAMIAAQLANLAGQDERVKGSPAVPPRENGR